MPEPSPAAELRTAAGRCRADAAEFGTELPGLLAVWLDAVGSRLEATAHPSWQDVIEPEALALARAINAEEQP